MPRIALPHGDPAPSMGRRFFLFRALGLADWFHAVLRHAVFRHAVLRHSASGDDISPVLVPCSDHHLWDGLSVLWASRIPWVPRTSVMTCHATSCSASAVVFLATPCSDRRCWSECFASFRRFMPRNFTILCYTTLFNTPVLRRWLCPLL